MTMLDDAIAAIRSGDKQEGRRILEEILDTEEDNEEVWLWLSSVVDTDEDREICLENVLALNPDNIVAQKGLEALRSGTFNVHNITGEILEEEEEGDLFSGATFHDQFFGVSDESADEDEELEWPSIMGGPQPQKAKKKAGKPGFLNTRLILLVLFGLIIVCGLGSAAAYNLFLASGSDGQSSEEQPGQTGPIEGTQPEVPPTETLTPEPTPTPTNTPFVLPTRKPTDLPTPTATPVVSPTPVSGG